MRWNKKNFFESRHVCRIEPEGADDGSGGGGGFGNESVDTFVPEGGTVDHDAGHSFEPQNPQSSDVGRAQQLLQGPEDQKISTSDIRSLLRLDLPKPAAAQPAAPKAPVQAAPAQPAAAAPAAPATPAQPQQPAGVEAVAAAIQEGFKNLQPAQPAQPEAPQAPPTFYGQVKPAMQVAPQIMQALFGENVDDNTNTAMGHLINGMMNQVVNDLMPMVYQLVQTQSQQVQQQIPQQVQQFQQTMTAQQKFFTKYEELSKPAFSGIVDAIAKQVKAEWKASNRPIVMNDEYFDAIGNRVHAHLKDEFGFEIPRKSRGPIAAPPAQPQQAQPPRPQPQANGQGSRFWANGSARPPAVDHVNGQSADLRNFV
jgi:hypothetical protein